MSGEPASTWRILDGVSKGLYSVLSMQSSALTWAQCQIPDLSSPWSAEHLGSAAKPAFALIEASRQLCVTRMDCGSRCTWSHDAAALCSRQ